MILFNSINVNFSSCLIVGEDYGKVKKVYSGKILYISPSKGAKKSKRDFGYYETQ